MVIERPVSGFSGWDQTAEHRPPSPATVAIAALIAAAHLAGALYIYTLKAAAPTIIPDDPPSIVVTPYFIKPDTRPVAPAKQPAVRVHAPLTPPDIIGVTIPFIPHPDQPKQITDDPPVIVTQPPKVDGAQASSGPPQPKTIENPRWLSRPSPEQLAEFYPPHALEDGVNGQAVLDCRVTARGELTQCSISGESPRNAHFGEAALKASRIFRMSPKTEDGQPVEGGAVHIPIHFAVKE